MITRVEGGLTYTQTFRQTQCDAFDVENRLISVTVSGQTTQFIYDGDGNLVKKINPNSSKTLYVGGIYEVDKASGGNVTRTVTYYPVAGAMRIDSTLYYVLKDHLGSASVVTNASGMEVGTQRYYPFGETRLTTGTIFTDKLFTGQREMAGLGIYHYQARFYSPKLGRFLSPDTIVPNYANPQHLNRFSYVYNNPIIYTDPTGHCGGLVGVLCFIGVTTIAVFGALTIANYLTANPPSQMPKGWNKVPGREIPKYNPENSFWGTEGQDPGFSLGKFIKDFCKKVGWLKCGSAAILIGASVVCAGLEGVTDGNCTRALSKRKTELIPESTPTPTLTPPNTSTNTPSCPPPFAECPNTSTPPANNTSTPPVSTPTPPPIFTPAPPNPGGPHIPV